MANNMFIDLPGGSMSGSGMMFDPSLGDRNFGGNQYFSNLPTLPNMGNPMSGGPNIPDFGGSGPKQAPTTYGIGGGNQAVSTLSPNFTQGLLNVLFGQLGRGATPYGGPLTAGYNPLVQNLQNFFSGGGSSIPGLGALGDIAQGGGPGADVMQQIMQGGGPGMEALMRIMQGGGLGQDVLSQFSHGRGGGQDILSMISQGKGGTGMDVLSQFAQSGMPIDQTPAWQAMVDSMQRQIGQQGAQLKESMGFTGNLVGSPFGNAMGDFSSQTAKDLNAQLLQAQTQAQESARQRQLSAAGLLPQLQMGAAGTLGQEQMGASEILGGQQAGAAGNFENIRAQVAEALRSGSLQAGQGILGSSMDMSSFLQNLDQSAVDRNFQEFLRTQPEYNPLLPMMYSMATLFPPIMSKNYGIGMGGALLSNAGGIASGIGDLIGAMKKK
jgi:hypothetical protein